MKHAHEAFSGSRKKITPQRIAIVNYLKNTKSHPSAEEIYSEVRKAFPTTSFATVYNTIIALKEVGQVVELNVDPGRKRFDMDMTPHHHFYCRRCGTIYDLIIDSVPETGMCTISGHSIENIQVNFTGICKNCKEEKTCQKQKRT